jgi:hypothetical protein
MSKNRDNRVLSRMGARCLDEHELSLVAGNGQVTTTYCSVPNPLTGRPDGDCD